MSVTTGTLVEYLLCLADDNMVLAQRLGELAARMPDLEEDIAVANVGLDHLGQARSLYAYAGEVEGTGRTEDDLALGRSEREFRNAVLIEQPNTDFAHVLVRQLLVDAYQVPLYDALTGSTDPTLAGIAAKAVKEARYHLRRSSTWVIRLGDGTEESHDRCQAAVDHLWRYAEDLFAVPPDFEQLVAAGVATPMDPVRVAATNSVHDVMASATLTLPSDLALRTGGREGMHTEHLGHLLTEMQWLHRSNPGATW